MKKRIITIPLLLGLILGAGSASLIAQTERSITSGGINLAKIRQFALDVESQLRDESLERQQLGDQVSTLTGFRSNVARCAQLARLTLDERTDKIAAIESNIEDLDDALKATADQQLKRSREEQAAASRELVDCQLLDQRLGDLVDTLTKAQNERLIERIQLRDKHIGEIIWALSQGRDDALASISDLITRVTNSLGRQRNTAIQLIPALVFGFVIAVWIRSHLVSHLRSAESEGATKSFTYTFLRMVYRYALLALPLAAASIFFVVNELRDRSFSKTALLVMILTSYVFALAAINFLLEPDTGYARVLTLRKKIVLPMARSLRVLATLTLVGAVFYSFLSREDVPIVLVDAARLLAMTIFTANALVFLSFLARARMITPVSRWLCYLLATLFIVALGAEWFGYRNFALYVVKGALGTSLAALILWLLNQFTREVFDGLDLGTRAWHRRIRNRIAIDDDEHIPGLIWFRLISTLLVWSLVISILLRAWGLSITGVVLLRRYIFDGFHIGEVTIVPIKIAFGILLFGTIVVLSRVIKSRLSHNSVLLSRLEPSARETLVTITGYIGFTIALLIGLSLAGIGFQNLAIVAGALSVGIGFGLQNIVNNFVSGIILLFERPIRRGDWVIVGGTEGFVKNINVRSTEIETWDRSDVIVPNSEFISSQVTNWTLSNAFGRVIVPVGVAYGSDTQKVKDILLEVAENNPQVIQKNNFFNIPEPVVLFTAFGSSSLDFELRCFVRDVKKRRLAQSEINFEIDRLFRENDIEIPFPQRDLHIRSDRTKGDQDEQ